MKRILLFATLFIGALATGCEDKPVNNDPVKVAVTEVKIDKESTTLVEGESETLTVTVSPDEATDKTVAWVSDTPTVADVDADGKVTAKLAGEATIKATAKDGSGRFDECVVTVTAAEVIAESVTMNIPELTLTEGEEETLVATVLPAATTDKSVSWVSDTPAVAEVDTNGKVTAKTVVTATITVTTNDGSEKTDVCLVTVEAYTPAAPANAMTDKVWIIGNQYWSDAINLSACNKTDYNGGTSKEPLADCRCNSVETLPYLYSWPYVDQNAATLCPDGWRVPTMDDFVALDLALGGDGTDNQYTDSEMAGNYLNVWGGQLGGYAGPGYLDGQDLMAYYWSTSVRVLGASTFGYCLNFSVANHYNDPMKFSDRANGFPVRCVQDKE